MLLIYINISEFRKGLDFLKKNFTIYKRKGKKRTFEGVHIFIYIP
nr:MAG TPA: hypothetical protein [Siphoviridae sp. ctTYz13]